jgi:hypothetical protein
MCTKDLEKPAPFIVRVDYGGSTFIGNVGTYPEYRTFEKKVIFSLEVVL